LLYETGNTCSDRSNELTTSKEARIEISTVCNHNCIFCPLNTSGFKRGRTMMSNEIFEELVFKLPLQIETVTLSGMGEPFLDIDIFDKIKILQENGYKVNILTNGSCITEEMVEQLIEADIESVRVSFHYIGVEEYVEITGSSQKSYLNAFQFITNFGSKRKNTKFILTADQIEPDLYKAKLLEKYFKSYVDLIEVWKVHNWSSWKTYRKGATTKTTCGRPKNGPLQIQVDGTINMCCFDFNGLLLLGDLKSQTIEEVFESKMMKEIESFHSGAYMNLLCGKCDQLYDNDESVIIYNSKYEKKKRLGLTSTNYERM